MERLAYRSTSLVDLQAELHERDLLRELRHGRPPASRSRPRALRTGLRAIARRLLG
jgi:hypothetical protein